MTAAQTLVQELQQEGQTTRRCLECVPEAKLAWRPHPKSRTLGQLALHVAETPSGVVNVALKDSLDAKSASFETEQPKSKAQILAALDASLGRASDYLASLDDKTAMSPWTMKAGSTTLFTVPRIAFLRSILFNHWYHHRGQLSVYLRLLDVPLPSVYGPSADENPFRV